MGISVQDEGELRGSHCSEILERGREIVANNGDGNKQNEEKEQK